jgi:hypothetical protein
LRLLRAAGLVRPERLLERVRRLLGLAHPRRVVLEDQARAVLVEACQQMQLAGVEMALDDWAELDPVERSAWLTARLFARGLVRSMERESVQQADVAEDTAGSPPDTQVRAALERSARRIVAKARS